MSILKGKIVENKYGVYFIPLSSQHKPAAITVSNGNIYEPETIKYIKENCGTGDIIHAGTYFGDFLPALSKAIDDDAMIWAFEPNTENFRCAQITIILNDLSNVEISHCGLGDIEKVGKLIVKDSKGNSLGGGSRFIDGDDNEWISYIKIRRIDDLIPNYRQISILQLDVESYEKEALIGAINTIKRCKPIIIMEDNNKIVKTDWFSDNILSLGYKIDTKIHQNYIILPFN